MASDRLMYGTSRRIGCLGCIMSLQGRVVLAKTPPLDLVSSAMSTQFYLEPVLAGVATGRDQARRAGVGPWK